MAEPLRIYLAKQLPPNLGKWEIYRDGTPTGEMVTNATIRKFLDTDQYKAFLLGEDIFLVPGTIFRKRNYKNRAEKKSMAYINQHRLKSD